MYNNILECLENLQQGAPHLTETLTRLAAMERTLARVGDDIMRMVPPADVEVDPSLRDTSLQGVAFFFVAMDKVRQFADDGDEKTAEEARALAEEGRRLASATKVAAQDRLRSIVP